MGFGDWLSDRWGNGPSMGGLKSSIKGTARTVGKVAPVVAGAALIPGVGGLLGGALGGVAGKIPGLSGLLSGGGADGKGNLGMLGDLAGKAGKIPGVGSLLSNPDALLAGAGLFMGAKDDARARGLEQRGLDYATRAYDEKQPLRALALSQLMQEQAPDLSGVLPPDRGSPYAMGRKVPGISTLPGL